MQKEKLSALMDGESFDSELLSSLSQDRTLQQSWQSYHLIRDTLRGDVGQVMHLDIADRVAAALEKEPARLVPSAVQESQPQPHTWQKMPFWDKVRPWASQITQIGMAACVSLAVIVGVQQYNQPSAPSNASESPPARRAKTRRNRRGHSASACMRRIFIIMRSGMPLNMI